MIFDFGIMIGLSLSLFVAKFHMLTSMMLKFTVKDLIEDNVLTLQSLLLIFPLMLLKMSKMVCNYI